MNGKTETVGKSVGFPFSATYWMAATVFYLVLSFVTGAWGWTWIAWLVAGNAYAPLMLAYARAHGRVARKR